MLPCEYALIFVLPVVALGEVRFRGLPAIPKSGSETFDFRCAPSSQSLGHSHIIALGEFMQFCLGKSELTRVAASWTQPSDSRWHVPFRLNSRAQLTKSSQGWNFWFSTMMTLPSEITAAVRILPVKSSRVMAEAKGSDALRWSLFNIGPP